MLFFLRKFIEALLLPLGFSGLLIIVGVMLRRRWIAVSGVLFLFTVSTLFMGGTMMKPLEHAYPATTVAAAPQADAIVVLSGGIVRGVNAPGVQWGDTANRYFAGFDLAKAGKAKLVVFTGASTNDLTGPSQGAVMKQTAVADGIEAGRIIVTGKVLTTDDEARSVAQIPNVHSVLLVTSGFHMPRAVLLFRAQGLEVSPFPTDQRSFGDGPVGLLQFIPDPKGLEHTEAAMREYYGLAAYHLLYLFRPLGRLR